MTAVIALAVGVWQTAETRRHNRLSVRPLLNFTTQVNVVLPDSSKASIRVTNRGLGLAELNDMEIAIQTRSGERETFDSWISALPAVEAYGVGVGSRADLGGGLLLEPGDGFAVLDLIGPSDIPVDSLLQILQRIDISVTYRSLYDESFTTHRNDPDER